MSKYTTGEIAKLGGVTVRTIQYYHKRGILIPTELTEGGRRLYSEDDLKRLRIICFLRDLGLPIDAIGQIFAEEDPSKVITLLLEQQEIALTEELTEQQEKLQQIKTLRHEMKSMDTISVESIGDIAYIMSNKKKLRKIHMRLLVGGIPLSILQLAAIILLITKGIYWLLILYIIIAIPMGIILSKYYFNNVAYICPQCHSVFSPAFKEAFFARHTPATRKLTCPSCGHHGFCVEVAKEESSPTES